MKNSKWLWPVGTFIIICLSIYATRSWHKFGYFAENGERIPAQVEIPKDLLQATESFLEYIRDPGSFSYQTCAPFLGQVYSALSGSEPGYFDYDSLKNNHLAIMKNLWLTRLELQKKVGEMQARGELKQGSTDDPCILNLRAIVRAARYVEDYLGEAFLGIPHYVSGRDPVAINTLQGEEPHLYKAPGLDTLKLRSGDMIISRGNAYTSAAIARMGEEDSQFSHLAYIYFDGESAGKELTIPEAIKDPNVKVMEAHIEIGSTIRPFAEYAADGNARNAVFRYPDAEKAHEAARWTYQFIKDRVKKNRERGFEDYPEWTYKYVNLEGKKVRSTNVDATDPNFSVPYDFKMDLSESEYLFCSEVAYVGMKQVGVDIPMFPTKIAPKSELVRVLGITSLVNFLPGDLELDPRFQYLAEWRDYRKLRNVRHKDAVLASMYSWMKDKDYRFHPPLGVKLKSLVGWLLRKFDFQKEVLPTYMKLPVISTVQTIDRVGEILQSSVAEVEENYKSSHQGLMMTFPQIKAHLDSVREMDEQKFKQRKSSSFHKLFNDSK